MAKPGAITGFLEWMPNERLIERLALQGIVDSFRLHGFSEIRTRAVEPVPVLLGKGGDADKEIYALDRLAAARDAKKKPPSLGLRFDLTVPLSRYVLENSGKLVFPFRRYQIQPVWRGERPQAGRYREFFQADIDIIGQDLLPAHHEIDLLLAITHALVTLPGGGFTMRLNNRKISEGVYRALGVEDITGTLRIVDKLDKIGPQKVATELVTAGITVEQADTILAAAQISTSDISFVQELKNLELRHPVLDEGIAELSTLFSELQAVMPAGVRLIADMRIARGLDYYTGTVFETTLDLAPDLGSVCSGGRYDSLASDGKRTFPGVGASIGVSRLLAYLIKSGFLQASRTTDITVLVALFSEDDRPRARQVAAALRGRGIAVLLSPNSNKLGKQIRDAQRRDIPYVWFLGRDGGDDAVKDIRSGQQISASADTWMPPAQDQYPTLQIGEEPRA